MERLTHEADFGLEDWEETLFFVKSDPNGAYNIIDIAKYQGEPEFDEILKNVALRLAAYENTGLEPEEIVKIREDIENGYMKSTARRYGVPVGRLRELAEADREGRYVVLPVVHGVPVRKIRPSKHEWYEEVKTENGEILYRKHVYVDETNWSEYCPACGKRLCSRFKSYCPNCGAKMDLEG